MGMATRFCPRNIIRRFRKNDDGAVAVEFAIGIMSMLLLMVAIMEFGRVIWMSNSIQYVAETTARHAALHEDASESDLQTVAGASLPGMPVSEMSLQVTRTSSGDVEMVDVVVSYSYAPMFGLIPIGTHTLTGRAATATY